MTEREELKRILLNIVIDNRANFTLESTYEKFVDFIIEDRKRIVNGIIRFKGTNDYIDETLRLAGIE